MKKKIVWVVLALVLIGLAGTAFYFYWNRLENHAFNAEEEQWLQSNKSNVVDIYIPRDIAGLTYMGNGVFFDFVETLEKKTEIPFNEVAYEVLEDVSDKPYAIELVENPTDNQLTILEDSYALITKEKIVYPSLEKIENISIGVLKEDLEKVQKYLSDSTITYTAYETEVELLEAFQKDDSTLNGIIGLESLYLDDLLTNDYHIAYHLSDLRKTYVLTLNGEDVLDSIISKTYRDWYQNHFQSAYYTNLLDTYFSFKSITEKEEMTLREKSYVYGFVENGAYDSIVSGELKGINYSLIKSFAEFANIDMEYQKGYESEEELENAFASGNVDFFFNPYVVKAENAYETVSALPSKVAILSPVDDSITVASLSSLTDTTVAVVKGTKIEAYLTDKKIKVKNYDSLEQLLKEKNRIIAIDLENYEYYKNTSLANYKMNYLFSLDSDYNYVLQKENKIFTALFDFYLEYMPVQTLVSDSYGKVFKVENHEIYYIIAIVVLAFIVLVQFLYNAKSVFTFFRKRRKKSLTKDEKIRYIDSLTSLKNRAYLNDNIEKWDNSEVYPQIIIIVDLNNIAYINDNFGHEEGDKVITEAANILIQTQMPRSEIIRTDGNEFLIYMVEYEEKQAVAYIRKLNKELKELSHGFGAATGWSMITDAIKTIDDAVNEATLDMKTNKEAMIEEER